MSNSNKTMRTFGGPPVLVSKFVQTHARVHFGDSGVYAELWEHPRRTYHRLRATERIAILGCSPAQPSADAKPRVSAL